MDGPQTFEISLPVGFGDCYIQRVYTQISSIATMMTAPEIFGPHIRLEGVGGDTQDFLAAGLWSRIYLLQLGYAFQPLLAALWREDERLVVAFDEVDTNAVPTADLAVFIYVQRRRNLGTARPEGAMTLQFTS